MTRGKRQLLRDEVMGVCFEGRGCEGKAKRHASCECVDGWLLLSRWCVVVQRAFLFYYFLFCLWFVPMTLLLFPACKAGVGTYLPSLPYQVGSRLTTWQRREGAVRPSGSEIVF